ncbi:hypothetical protein MMYC01_201546 [Madurella mycetomatis]|uniref:Uncharacterized protein n=1 Tax=Madurella mycetomatis TaxID=100816 RepID=A0A175WEV8_9PEZI|nr:hypothetical protein MMYC01_201546 [Madurella mycetomatis]
MEQFASTASNAISRSTNLPQTFCFAEGPNGDEWNLLAFQICNLPHGLHVDCHRRIDTALQLDHSPLPLHTRAWVLQERILAPRTLYYGAWGFAWASFLRVRIRAGSTPEVPSPEKAVAMFSAWLDVRAAYTGCQLTYFDDRLVAVSGVVGRIEKLTSWKGLWGIWEERLLHELSWFVDEPSARPHTEEYLAPTWSWAGVRGRVFEETAVASGSGNLPLGLTKSPGRERMHRGEVDKDRDSYAVASWAADTVEESSRTELAAGEGLYCLLLSKNSDQIQDQALITAS